MRKDKYNNLNQFYDYDELEETKESKVESEKSEKKKRNELNIFSIYIKIFVLFFLIVSGIIGGAVTGLGFSLAKLPDISNLQYYNPNETTEIYDDKGRVLAKLHDEENRKIIKLKDIPKNVQNAVIAIEDSRFFHHKGIDLKGITRAFKDYIEEKGVIRQGGSTITQQIIKNLFLTPERTISRKIAEAWLAIQIENKFSKQQILEIYLNQVYWGHNAYGIEAAANTYFGKTTKQLNIAEAAMLAGLLQGPEIYSPYHSMKKAKERQKIVLERMAENNFIKHSDIEKIYNTKIKLSGIKRGVIRHPYFTTYVIHVLNEKYGHSRLIRDGLKVYTTIDTKAQAFAEELIKKEIERLKYNRVQQGALVSLDPNTGYIKAMVGGTNFGESQFNRAWQAQRQPGSSFKPFVYLTAFLQGYSPGNVEIDEPIQYRFGNYVWRPHNYGGRHGGAMTLQTALIRSVNIIAIKLGDKVGLNNVISVAKRAGIQSELKPVLSMPLGSLEVTPLEMASAYGTFATLGIRVEPTPILKIVDKFGYVIENNTIVKSERVFPDKEVSILVEVMKGVITRGTGTAAYIGRPAAGKTGTTESHRDAWFIGFIPQLVTAVWVGNDTPIPMWGATGGTFAAPIWAKYMKFVTEKIPIQDFKKPEGLKPIVEIKMDINDKNKDKEERLKIEEKDKDKEDKDKKFVMEKLTSEKKSNRKTILIEKPIFDELIPLALPSNSNNKFVEVQMSKQNSIKNEDIAPVSPVLPSKNVPTKESKSTRLPKVLNTPKPLTTPLTSTKTKSNSQEKIIQDLNDLIEELNELKRTQD